MMVLLPPQVVREMFPLQPQPCQAGHQPGVAQRADGEGPGRRGQLRHQRPGAGGKLTFHFPPRVFAAPVFAFILADSFPMSRENAEMLPENINVDILMVCCQSVGNREYQC